MWNTAFHSTGFTVVELIIVIALGAGLVALTAPGSVAFYQRQVADGAFDEVVALLRRAQADAAGGKFDLAHGVSLDAGVLSWYCGPSFLDRSSLCNETIILPRGLTLTGMPQDLSFERGTGLPSATGTILVSLYRFERGMILDDQGRISPI